MSDTDKKIADMQNLILAMHEAVMFLAHELFVNIEDQDVFLDALEQRIEAASERADNPQAAVFLKQMRKLLS